MAEKREHTARLSANPLTELAPGKVNLCLFLGPTRASDGRHELMTVYESVSLADELTLTVLGDGAHDEVVCPGVSGSNLAGDALAALRALGWDAPAVRIEIDKRIPVAAGMGGGSADAAAALRLAGRVAPVPASTLVEIATMLGADVPAQLEPGLSLGTGAGEVVEALAPLEPHAFAIVPLPHALSTAAVYAEADRLGLGRRSEELAGLRADWREHIGMNDLEVASRSLCPAIDGALKALDGAGADHVLVCGSGPTCAGLWWGAGGIERARDAVTTLVPAFPEATAVVPVAGIGHNSGQDR
jgi:4-diphosphocytidyl-2-C-methyl-D-erythritol kinase